MTQSGCTYELSSSEVVRAIDLELHTFAAELGRHACPSRSSCEWLAEHPESVAQFISQALRQILPARLANQAV